MYVLQVKFDVKWNYFNLGSFTISVAYLGLKKQE